MDGRANDGFCEDKPSTNGTWLCLMEEMPIKDGMIFKSNQNQYKCTLIKQNMGKWTNVFLFLLIMVLFISFL